MGLKSHVKARVGLSEVLAIGQGYQVAQLVGCLTHNLRVVGSIPTDANCFMSDNIVGQDVNLDCVSLHPGEKCLAWQQ